ncbi:MAG: Na+/H+ antiporter subunit E [Chloroflexales bacterium]|nr:Na+/H+ antiporter subunit E [Chloroflexales bacterium]
MFLLNLLFALTWVALTGQFGPLDLAFGFALGFGLLWLARGQIGGERYFEKGPVVVRFVLYILWEIIVANLNVARTVLFTPRAKLRPGIIAVPLDVTSDVEITMLANIITLTPGTLSLDVSDDRKVLYVHAIDVDDPDTFRQSIKGGLERAVRGVFA